MSVITLGVVGLAASRAFYDRLGWRAANAGTDEVDSIVAYDLNGFSLALYPLDHLTQDATVPLTKGAHPSVTLAYVVSSPDQVDQMLTRAERAGGALVKPAQKVSWGGYSGYFADPDGYLWEVAHNPFATLGADGSFKW
ncbi:VOC family protein [Rhodothalassium salexigens]|uniref:VOC family protein n=1 Tax=Rhodothalassium salexigens TaxID=1086 RepID=UPI0019129A1C|nr:VOC family protein [Rhodothalassium salexigens]